MHPSKRKNFFSEPPPPKKTKKGLKFVIVGAGISGLYSAMTLISMGHHVTLVDKRADYTLPFYVNISEKALAYFELLSHHLNIELTNHPIYKTVFKIKDIKLFLSSALQAAYQRKCLPINENEYSSIEGHLEIFKGPGYQVDDIDKINCKVICKNNECFKFDHIIDATGTKRSVIKKLNEKYPAYLKEISQNTEVSEGLPEIPHRKNAILNFKYEPLKHTYFTCFKSFELGYSNKKSLLEEIKSLGWSSNHLPFLYTVINNKTAEAYIVSEIPDSYSTEQTEKIFNFTVALLKSFHITSNNIALKDVDLIRCTTFNLNLDRLKSPYTIISHVTKACAIPVGDCLVSSNFHYGNGISKALNDVENLRKVFAAPHNINFLSLQDNFYKNIKEMKKYHEAFEKNRNKLKEIHLVQNEEVEPVEVGNSDIRSHGYLSFLYNTVSALIPSYLRTSDEEAPANSSPKPDKRFTP